MNPFDTSGFVPRWSCGDWAGGLGWVEVVALVATALAYVAIPVQLLRVGRRRKDLPYRPQAMLFAAFVFCCGVSHALSAVIFWHPVYRFLVLWDVLTAVVSAAAVVRLSPIIPELVAMRTPKEMAEEIERRKAAEASRGEKVTELEQTERNLRHANRDLQNAIAAKRLLEQRIREMQAHHEPDHTGTTPTQAAIARMDEATRAVANTLSPPPAEEGAGHA